MEVYLRGKHTLFIDTGECLIFLDNDLFYLAKDFARLKRRMLLNKFSGKHPTTRSLIKAYIYLFKTCPFFSEVFDTNLLDPNGFEITEINNNNEIGFTKGYYFNFKDGALLFDINLNFIDDTMYDRWLDNLVDDKTFIKHNTY